MTITNKHTPGPWRAWKEHNSNVHQVCTVAEDKRLPPDIKAPLVSICRVHVGYFKDMGAQPGEAAANARLIAAAPELLAALEWCEKVYGKDWPENASIRETINKAKGE